MVLTAAAAALLGFLYVRDGRNGVRPPDRSRTVGIRTCGAWILSFLVLYFGLTAVINLSGLPGADPGFHEVSAEGEGLWFFFVRAVLLAPLLEELLFRGLIYRRIRGLWGERAALLISALLFGLFHGNVTQGIFGFLCGLMLAAAYERTDALLVSILMHAAANGAGILVSIFF